MITRYVNTASTAGGDGTTNLTTGSTRAWASMSEAITALTGAGYSEDLTVWCSGSVADTTPVAFSSSYLANGYTLSFIGNPNTSTGFHGGKLNLGAYRLHTSYHAIFPQSPLYPILVFDGIQVVTDATNGLACFYANNTLGAGSAIRNCIIRNEGTNGHGLWSDAGCSNLRIENNVIVGYGSGHGYGVRGNIGGGTMYVYNNIIVGHANGVDVSGGWSVTVKNDTVFNNTNDFSGTMTIDHCASDAGSGTNPVTVSNWSNQFYNPNYMLDVDFSLKTTSVLLNAGVGPSIDVIVPATDIIALDRSGPTSSVGPFEHYYGWTIPIPFPANPYDGQEHRVVLSGSLYVYDASKARWVKSLYYSKGVTGILGDTGASTPGQQGAVGIPGQVGIAGATGIPGTTGVGAFGTTGVQGITGAPGVTGSPGVTGPDPGVTGFINFVMNNPSTGIAGFARIPYSVRFGSWEVVSSDVTSFRADVRIGPYSAWPPTYVMNGSVTGPHIGGTFKNADYDLSDWLGTTGSEGDWLQLNVVESDSPESVTVALGYYQT